MIIDFHTHIFPPGIKERRSCYLSKDHLFADLYSDPKAKIATAEDVIASMDREGVDVSVVMGGGWATQALCVETNDYILEAINRYPERLVGFCAVQPLVGKAAVAEIERCARGGVRGIGELRSDVQGFDLGDEAIMAPIVEMAMQHRLIILSHASEPVGHLYPGKGTVTADILYRFTCSFPEQPIVYAHWGGGLPFYALMPEIDSALENVFFDTAASPFLYRDQVYGQVAELVGVGKILFGSDYPLLPPQRYIDSIHSLSLSEDAKDMILGGNARKLLGIN